MVMLLFSCFGAIFGMSEETLAFVIIIVPLAISMGYDSLTGVCMVYVAPMSGLRSNFESLHDRYRTRVVGPSVIFRFRVPDILLGHTQRDHDSLGVTLRRKSQEKSQGFTRVQPR